MDKPKTRSFIIIAKALLPALLIGLLVGWVRYWIGYYILIQGVIAGLLIAWLVKKTAKDQHDILSAHRFKIAVILFFVFVFAEAIGFGFAQPVFNPFNWFARVWNGETVESVFGIFSTGGVVHKNFSGGFSGGFWFFLTLVDMFFMFFFILISMPLSTKKP